MSKTLSDEEKRKRRAFMDEVREVERKHGYRMVIIQPPVQVVPKPIEEFIPDVSPELAARVAQLAGYRPAKKSLFEYLKKKGR